MIRKRNKFWTVVLAVIPGAGHMFNGFMKLGLSYMGIFAGVFLVASWLRFDALAMLEPVIWFFAFFDCINRRFMDDDEFYAQEDHYLITEETLKRFHLETTERSRQIVGVALIVVGVYAIWNNIFGYWMVDLLPYFLRDAAYTLSRLIPQVIVAVLIIWAGVSLVRGKRKEMEQNVEKESENVENPQE